MIDRLILVAGLVFTFAPAFVASKPHIVFIVADDLGWNDIGFNNPDIISPNIDKLAKDGIILDQSYVQPLCSPSRSAFMTGLYPYKTGLQHLVIMPEQAVCAPRNVSFLPEEMRKLGYKTHMVGKWHLGFCNLSCTPTERGFDSFFGYYNAMEDYYNRIWQYYYDFRENTKLNTDNVGTYSTFVFKDRMKKVIESHDPSQPLFLYLPLQSVHSPLQVPLQYYNMYPNIHNADRRTFSGMVTAMDDVIGNLTAALTKRGMVNDTLFVFTSDNGGNVMYAGNNYPLRGGKYSLWEGGTRAVAFLSGQGLNVTGARYKGLLHAVDWLPTLVAAGGGHYQGNDIDGQSMWDAIRTGSESPRTEFIYNLDDFWFPGQGHAGIRQGDYKLLMGFPGLFSDWYLPNHTSAFPDQHEALQVSKRLFTPAKKNKLLKHVEDWNDQPRLYNLKDDPEERHNLAEQMPGVVAKLQQRMAEYHQHYVPPNYPEYDPKADPTHFGGAWSPGWC